MLRPVVVSAAQLSAPPCRTVPTPRTSPFSGFKVLARCEAATKPCFDLPRERRGVKKKNIQAGYAVVNALARLSMHSGYSGYGRSSVLNNANPLNALNAAGAR